MYLDGGKESVKRPRVRHVEDGEVELESYRAGSSQVGLFEEVVGLVAEGMSQRGLGRVKKDDISKSAISRMWEEKSREQLAMVRERSLKGADWLAVMIDGVFIGGENCVVIALGIEASGRKQVLDFEVGSSENRDTVERLIGRLEGRGVQLEDEFTLLVGTFPRVAVAAVTAAWASVATVPVVGCVVGSWDKPSQHDLFVDGSLQGGVEAGAFFRHVVDVGDLGLAGDGELVTRIAGKSQALRIVGNEFDSHDVMSFRWLIRVVS